MTQAAETTVGSPTDFEQVGTGLNVYESSDVVEGVVKWLDSPEDVIEFVNGDDVSNVVVVARGGTTTFLTMALNAGVKGVITLQGAPESHLGILSREFGIPCIMSVTFDKGVRTPRGEVIPADGVRVRLDVSSRPQGTVSVEPGAPVDDTPVEDAGPAMSPEQMAQIQLLLEKFGGEVPHGSEGDVVMQSQMSTRGLYLDEDTLHRPLTTDEVNEVIKYYTWNEWDALASRATEGESGLIPRQEYEAMGIMNCWFKHPEWLAAIEERVGEQGVIDIGAIGHREIGTKVNMLHLWALATAPSFGRGIALELGLHDLDYRTERIRNAYGTVRRLYKGLWQEGGFLSSMRDFKAPLLDQSWIDRFAGERIALDSEETRSAFQRFNGAAELMGFLLHFDNRLGLGDTGPYPTEGGGFVVVRDLFVNEPAFPWSDACEGLPYAFTIAMFFDKDSGIDVQMTDLSTMFTTPANYLPHISGVAVYARDTWDTPVDQVRALSLDELVSLRTLCEEKASDLYKRIAAMSQREKIEAGAMVYTAGFALPVARAAGMYDQLVSDYGFLEIHPAVRACYDTIISGVATEMIPRLFLTGSWGNPITDHEVTSMEASDNEIGVLHALRVCGFADAARLADSSGLTADDVSAELTQLAEKGHVQNREGRVSGSSLTPAGKSRHVMLLHDRATAARRTAIAAAYDRFLDPNGRLKALVSESQLNAGSDINATLQSLHAEALEVVDLAKGEAPWFDRYGQRLQSALDAYLGGDADALAKPMTGSYHDVWMELHEDLLVSLDRERDEADG